MTLVKLKDPTTEGVKLKISSSTSHIKWVYVVIVASIPELSLSKVQG